MVELAFVEPCHHHASGHAFDPQGSDEPPSRGEAGQQGLGHRARHAVDEDAIEAAERAIGLEAVGVPQIHRSPEAAAGDPFMRSQCERAIALERNHLPAQGRQQGGDVAGAGADLEDAGIRLHVERAEQARHRVGRGHRLSAGERNRDVLPREVGEASALLGIASMMRAQWPQLFRSEFIEWVRAKPAFVQHVFDGHLCLSEFCLCSAKGHAEVAGLAQELLAVAEEAESNAGRGLACLLLGEASLFSGELDSAEQFLTEAERLLLAADAVAGRVLAIERLAEIALERGQKWRASRLIQRGLTDAERSWLSPHLIMRMQALAVRAASTPKMVAEEILAGDWLLTPGACQPCSMALRTASAIALAEAGELEQVDRRLNDAERIAGMWQGGPWAAALWEARGVQRRAQDKEVRALAAFEEAASRYEELGRPRDQARCLARMGKQG